MNLIPVTAALSLVATKMPDWGNVRAPLGALSRGTLAEPLLADRDYPPFHRVMMDGIAVSHEAYATGRRSFKIVGIGPAGAPAARLEDFSTAFEVMTGAPLPEGADLVIPYEDIEIAKGVATVTEEEERTRMQYVHLRGSDGHAGEMLLTPGAAWNGPHWGIAASLGYSSALTERTPRVLVISTGDELVAVDDAPEPYQIRRSNAHALAASLRLNGISDIELAHLTDDAAAIETHFREVSGKFDVLLYSGGVSRGKFDYLPSVWEKCGVKKHFHGVRQKPGKPLYFGVHEETKTAVFGLPGNPVSSLVCLHRYFLFRRDFFVRLEEEFTFTPELTLFAPAKIRFTTEGTVVATILPIQNSGEFSALAGSDGFVEFPPERSVFRAGEVLRFISWIVT